MAFDLVPFKRNVSFWDALFERHHFHYFGGFDFGVPMDINERKDKYVVTAEIPGMGAKDFNVTLNDNLLTVKGEKKSEYQKMMMVATVLSVHTAFSHERLDSPTTLNMTQVK